MISVKLKFRHDKETDLEGRIFFQLNVDRRVRHIPSPYRILPVEWDSRYLFVREPEDPSRRAMLTEYRSMLMRDLTRVRSLVQHMIEMTPSVSADELVLCITDDLSNRSLSQFMLSVAASLRNDGKIRTAETYEASLMSFMRFYRHTFSFLPDILAGDPSLDDLTPALMERYQSFLYIRGLAQNTISFYMRTLRAVYNRAVDKGLVAQSQPFRRVYTGVARTVKRALPLAMIRKIKGLDLTAHPELDFARDIFMLSFYLRGMSFIDMAFLRKKDLSMGCLTYVRRKTGQRLSIAWTREMQAVVGKYFIGKSDYLLPILSDFSGCSERSAYRNAGYNINRNLKRIGSMVGAPFALTLYVARHSWASIAKHKGIPLGVISEGMGHESESTTRIYLASLDNTLVDKANALILRSI